jgi:hypothetical protein
MSDDTEDQDQELENARFTGSTGAGLSTVRTT